MSSFSASTPSWCARRARNGALHDAPLLGALHGAPLHASPPKGNFASVARARRAMLTPPTVWCALVPPRSQPCGYKIEFEEIHDGEEKAPAILLKMKEALGGDATTSVDDALKRACQARLFASFAISLTLPCYLISPPLSLAS
jgi:hypothetical protein